MSQHDESSTQTSQADADSALIVASGLLMLFTAAIAATVDLQLSRPDDRLFAVVARANAICTGVGILLLIPRRVRRIGVALGFGAALVLVPPAIFFLGFIVLFGGLASNVGTAWALLTALAVVTLIVTGLGARQHADAASWLVGLIAPPLVTAVLMAITAPNNAPLPHELVQRDSSYRKLQASLEGTWRCLGAFQERESRYPASLEELPADCDLARAWPGPVEYLAARPAANGTVQAYSLCGTVPSPIPGQHVAGRASQRGARSDPTGYSSSRACGAGDVAGILHCALAFEARHQAQGFPSSLRELGPTGTDCLAAGQSLGNWSLESGFYRYTYLPGLRDPDGRITSFTIVGWPTSDGLTSHLSSLFVDQTGVVRFALDDRFAGPADPVWAGEDSGEDRIERRPLERLVPACRGGEAQACHRLGAELRRLDALYRRDRENYPSAGAGGSTVAFEGLENSQAALDQACRDGSGVACREWGRSLRLSQADAAEILGAERTGCDLGDATACYEMAQMSLLDDRPANDLEAVRLLERACDAGVVDGCLSLATVLREGRGVARDSTRAERLLRYACAGLASGCTNYR